jgi:hypothetical protein
MAVQKHPNMMNVRQPMLLMAAGVTLVTTKLNSHYCCVSMFVVVAERGEEKD